MNTGQMMITIAAMVFLATMVINVNKGFNNTSAVLTDSKLRVLAVSEATSIFEDATSLAFDAKTDTASLASITSLTPAGSLGLESGESSADRKTFDDFDDYKCYKTNPLIDSVTIMTSNPKLPFKVFCDVYYVSDAAPSTISTSPTWHKRMDLKVTSIAMGTDTVKMSIIYSYWYFR